MIEVEVKLDDDQKPADKKKADGDKDKQKVEEKRRTVVLQAKVSPEVAKLNEQIKGAAKKGDADEVAELVEKLEKALRSMPKVLTLDGDMKPGAGGGFCGGQKLCRLGRLCRRVRLLAMAVEGRFVLHGFAGSIHRNIHGQAFLGWKRGGQETHAATRQTSSAEANGCAARIPN